MSRPDRQERFLDRIGQAVNRLDGSGLSERHLRWGALSAAAQGLPLRDAIVLREARQREAMETPAAIAAWRAAIDRCRAVLAESTMRIWIDPIELVGEHERLLVVSAPTQTHVWVQRRYSGLLGEAVRASSDFGGVRFASVTLPVSMRQIGRAA